MNDLRVKYNETLDLIGKAGCTVPYSFRNMSDQRLVKYCSDVYEASKQSIIQQDCEAIIDCALQTIIPLKILRDIALEILKSNEELAKELKIKLLETILILPTLNKTE